VKAHVAPAEIVGKEEHNVGTFGSGGRRGKEQKVTKEAE
jgi:hypothetical protein